MKHPVVVINADPKTSFYMENFLSRNSDWEVSIFRDLSDAFIPVNGTLTLTVTPRGEDMEAGDFPADLEVQIQGSDFCADIGDGETHHENCFNVDSYTGTAFIGWLPG